MAFLDAPIVRGEKRLQKVTIGEFLDNSPVTMPVATVAGATEGPTVVIFAGIHGDESTGIDICRRVIQDLDPAKLTGTVVAVPVANGPSHLSRTRGFLHEERWLIDINRVFPGNREGLLTHRIAAILFDEFVCQADLTIDLHSALDGCIIAPFVYVDPDDDQAGTLDVRSRMAELVGTDYVYRKPRNAKFGTSDLSASINAQADAAKRAVLLVEMGESRRVSEDMVPVGVNGVHNVLRAMGVESGEVEERANPPRRFSNITIVHAEHGGGLRLETPLKAEVTEGQRLGTIVDMFGEVVEEVVAPTSGFILRRMLHGSAASGAELYWIGS